jgi:hypothetical protein
MVSDNISLIQILKTACYLSLLFQSLDDDAEVSTPTLGVIERIFPLISLHEAKTGSKIEGLSSTQTS